MQTETVRLHRSRRISWLIFKARTTSIFKSMENLRPESFDVGAVKSEIFPQLGLEESNPGVFAGQWFGSGPWIEKRSPIDGSFLGRVVSADRQDYERAAGAAHSAAKAWSGVPAPRRGEVVRRLAERLRQLKQPLGLLVTLEVGKIFAEGEGEVQEMIDICDFANGLSRQLYGLTIASERPNHRILENWHPLGLIGIISAFNFPVAVWSWNSALAIVCGNATLWKPSEKTPLTAVACVKIAAQVCHEAGVDPAIFSLVSGDSTVGTMLAEDRRALLVSATGSTRMGKQVANAVAKRLGRTLLELGGNNAVIVTPSANLALAVRALLFGAVGTTGQRCTTTRRLIAHQSLKDRLVEKLQAAYSRIRIGNPLRPEILMGPLIDPAAVEAMHDSLRKLEKSDGRILYGGESLQGPDYPSNNYVTPCIAEASNSWPVVQQETFAPILYVLSYNEFDEAIEIHNQVPQGLSSAIFSANISETEKFTSHQGSDCGLANVNVGTSGAEIGGAFGGEKETGGGRESGSDAWKAYMRRQTVTINYGSDLPLAQGIRFE